MIKARGLVPAKAIASGFIISAAALTGLDRLGVRGLDYAPEAKISYDSIEQRVQEPSQVAPSISSAPYSETPDYKVKDFSNDSDKTILARMIYGEARGCSRIEKLEVGLTAINRANDGIKWNGETIKEAVLAPKQYSCFNEDDVNREKLMDPMHYDAKSFEECLSVAQDLIDGKYENDGATSYYDHKMKNPPKWASSMERIGRIKTPTGFSAHEFFKPQKKEQKKTNSKKTSYLINEYVVEQAALRMAA